MKQKTLITTLGLMLALSGLSLAKDGVFIGVNAGLAYTNISYKKSSNGNFYPEDAPGYSVGLDVGYTQSFNKYMGLRYYLSYNFSQTFGEKSVFLNSSGQETIYNNGTSSFNNMLLANVDYFVNLNKMFEVYAGFGVGYAYSNTNLLKAKIDPANGGVVMSINQGSEKTVINGEPDTFFNAGGGFVLPINVGLSINITNHQVLRMGVKIPLLSTDLKAVRTRIPLLSPQLSALAGIPKGEDMGSIKNVIAQLGYSYTF
ncbi:hypothetical protein BKH43_07325 [Helicobacter sp. 13S00401-1]|uniref:outer membrane beta-barrel protein n=1 Tax=Helicobacter sp. 13S00401-1 TaxID=1905758 RepID=UPI000BA5B51E|nr:outer membrane beta-barrel protein [Helicobacter sp. 13S00401-1]PAF49048.1 hypothetical protein BKH43_07325 [Helicobacter sp. 13S00401-1]